MKKILICLLMILVGIGGYFCLVNKDDFNLEKVEIKNIDLKDNELKITFDIPKQKEVYCLVSKDEKDDNWVLIKDNTCTTKLEKGVYNIYLKENEQIYKISDTSNLKSVGLFEFSKDTIYLAVGGQEKLELKLEAFGNVDDIKYEVENEDVATIDDGIVTGKSVGETNIKAKIDDNEISIKIVVTKVITAMPKTFDYQKIKVPCKAYTPNEAELLDTILFDRVDEAGYQTRAGVVAAIRFLMLEFPYRINYYSENGRMTTELKADGEGRYYHRGLYLSEKKYSTVNSNLNNSYGPKMWGCPLYSFLSYKELNNGFDCSGFVTWTLINGGFDVGDIGAGPSADILDLTDYGEKVSLTNELINSGKIKAGDLIGYDGHIAIIAGIDDENIYVAEALWGEAGQPFGVVMTQYKKSTINKTLHYVMLMDSYYKEDGNYTAMWY